MKKMLLSVLILSLLFSAVGCKKDPIYLARVSSSMGFSGDMAVPSNFGFIDEKGNYVIEPLFYDAGDYGKGLAPVCNSDLWGYIDETGDYVIEPKYARAQSFSDNGLACVLDDDTNLWGYIDKTGEFVIEPQFYAGEKFSDTGIAAVMRAGSTDHYEYINKEGEYVTQPQSNAISFSGNGLTPMQDHGSGLWGYIDKTGNYVIEPQFYYAYEFVEVY